MRCVRNHVSITMVTKVSARCHLSVSVVKDAIRASSKGAAYSPPLKGDVYSPPLRGTAYSIPLGGWWLVVSVSKVSINNSPFIPSEADAAIQLSTFNSVGLKMSGFKHGLRMC